MGATRMFRDRVVSLEQTQEIGEKHIELLGALIGEALPGFSVLEHSLEHERDLFVVQVGDASGQTKTVSFTRMVLSDAQRIPAIVADPNDPMRERMVASIRAQADRRDIAVTLRKLLTADEAQEAEGIESEWRTKNEAVLAARRAEEERRERERRQKRQQEEQRRRAAQQAQQGRDRRPAAGGAQPAAPPNDAGRPGRRRRRRGRQGGAPGQPSGDGTRPATVPAMGASVSDSTLPQARSDARPQQAPGGQPSGKRRRRRRGRGGGGPKPGGAAAPN